MIFAYQATTKEGEKQTGNLDAPNVDLAIASLQRRGLIILEIRELEAPLFQRRISFLPRRRFKMRDLVILSRQISTLFEAKVSALQTFRLLASEAVDPQLRRVLTMVTDDVNAGMQISDALAKHPEVFSEFYVSMVKSGEEAGKLSDAFTYLAAYLERSHALVSKAKNALIYPAFIVVTFILVMILMLVFVIPRIRVILLETGQDIPIYTKIVLGFSSFFVDYGVLLLILFGISAFFLTRWFKTPAGRLNLAGLKLAVPHVGRLFQKLYLSRIADNLSTMLTSGISMVRALEITAVVVGNDVYRKLLLETADGVKGGNSISLLLNRYPEIPAMMVQMIKVGEESGKLGFILETLSRFYQREVYNEVETLVDLIEPALIVFLGLAVGILLAAVLIPIYNIASGI